MSLVSSLVLSVIFVSLFVSRFVAHFVSFSLTTVLIVFCLSRSPVTKKLTLFHCMYRSVGFYNQIASVCVSEKKW